MQQPPRFSPQQVQRLETRKRWRYLYSRLVAPIVLTGVLTIWMLRVRHEPVNMEQQRRSERKRKEGTFTYLMLEHYREKENESDDLICELLPQEEKFVDIERWRSHEQERHFLSMQREALLNKIWQADQKEKNWCV